MLVQVKFAGSDRWYTYRTEEGAEVGDRVATPGNDYTAGGPATIVALGSDYTGPTKFAPLISDD